ncbi:MULTISPECIES: hypothetical protein [unclassified Rhizobium]|uniref:hypothetical protein n=1 Tax=unclassified Rhizobium TaxID=2613769 RepID=UPI001ADD5385|nr:MULTISPECIES: hypothetical protein [unclassified Rhizobium]MBO9102157.1 hypothetical protein [Rhizobium sp. L58/93]MBO9171911.1 hypothetical protein [Rhizobium sp. L245/93]MBO9186430.1 hypothetical protein [Rhizobium sp. E27B/91]QXZ87215.1 hypothetical protein J5287_21885 [Rhizobium sp. K1/93]QXZ92752.1 hypothetical protein J5280_19010 [Rhizobium sp. K15/93]
MSPTSAGASIVILDPQQRTVFGRPAALDMQLTGIDGKGTSSRSIEFCNEDGTILRAVPFGAALSRLN